MRNGQGNCRWAAVTVAAISMMLAAIAAPAQSFKNLVNFMTSGGGEFPYAPLIQGTDGSLYGTTDYGGNQGDVCDANGCGTVFRMTPAGTVTTVYKFCAQSRCPDGSTPEGGLLQGTDGDFYGTTFYGGANDYGTVFKLTRQGVLTVLHSFDYATDGAWPTAGLIQGTDGNFYGTTSGGVNGVCSPNNGYGCGTVFRVDPSGALTNLHSFCSQSDCADGAQPFGPLIQGGDGNYYGTTSEGGSQTSCCGTIYRVTPQGAFTTLYSFCSGGSCGELPSGNLVQARSGTMYGTTRSGGYPGYCPPACGTVFSVTARGTLNTLATFNETNGAGPTYLVLGTGGNLYGTTYGGNNCDDYGCGTIFSITPGGLLTTLYSFSQNGGYNPWGGLSQDTNGSFYGTTTAGGLCCGTAFVLSVGLVPFVKSLPAASKVGRSVVILGTKLTNATSVTFNGAAAAFTVESPTAIKTTVPTGATTGPVQVVTPSGTLTSNVNFQVLQ